MYAPNSRLPAKVLILAISQLSRSIASIITQRRAPNASLKPAFEVAAHFLTAALRANAPRPIARSGATYLTGQFKADPKPVDVD
jgi:hypothetical protein